MKRLILIFLLIISACGAKDGNQPPTIRLTASPDSGPLPLTVYLTAIVSDADGYVGQIRCLKDGNWTRVDNVAYFQQLQNGDRYDWATSFSGVPGEHIYTCKAFDNNGKATEASVAITLQENRPPSITLTADITTGVAPLTVKFSVDATDPESRISNVTCTHASTLWSSGGNPRDRLQSNYSYKFSQAGRYTEKCTITDAEGVKAEATVQIAVDGIRILFPDGVTYVKDIVYDRPSSLIWLVVKNNTHEPARLIALDIATGQAVSSITPFNEDSYTSSSVVINNVAFDGDGFWIELVSGLLYKYDKAGNRIASALCPATNTGGYCDGLAWDGNYLWAGASDNRNLVKFSVDGTAQAVFTNIWSTIGVDDLAYDSATKTLLALKKSHLLRIDPASGTILGESYLPGAYKGDWDGERFWFPNNQTQEINAVAP